jgi:hypothetical protein
MAVKQEVFAYTDEQLSTLEKTLSEERMRPYLLLAGNDKRLAIKLYEWNTGLSESFYGVLQGLEIALRNAMHSALRGDYGRDDWYDICPLSDPHKDMIRKAKERIIGDKKLVLPGKVVSELTFGFWVVLTSPSYAQSVWDKALHKAFVRKLGRKTIHKRLEKIRKLRNRVAHHESILERNLKDDFSLIVETVHWICPVTADWLKANNSFHARYAEKPICEPSVKGNSVAKPMPT